MYFVILFLPGFYFEACLQGKDNGKQEKDSESSEYERKLCNEEIDDSENKNPGPADPGEYRLKAAEIYSSTALNILARSSLLGTKLMLTKSTIHLLSVFTK